MNRRKNDQREGIKAVHTIASLNTGIPEPAIGMAECRRTSGKNRRQVAQHQADQEYFQRNHGQQIQAACRLSGCRRTRRSRRTNSTPPGSRKGIVLKSGKAARQLMDEGSAIDASRRRQHGQRRQSEDTGQQNNGKDARNQVQYENSRTRRP